MRYSLLFAIGFPIYFVVLWCTVAFLISALGGWRSLAEIYRSEGEFPSHARSFQSGDMRLQTHYNGILRIGSDSRGLYLAVLFLFRLGHPQLFIPWQDITIEPPKRYFLFMRQVLRLGPDAIPLRLKPQLVEFVCTLNPIRRADPSAPS